MQQVNEPPSIGNHRAKLITRDSVCDLTGVQKSTIYLWLADPKSDFPRPVRLGARMVRWIESDVLHWVQIQIDESTGRKCPTIQHDGPKADYYKGGQK